MTYLRSYKNGLNIELKPRTKENVIIYFQRVQDEEIRNGFREKETFIEDGVESKFFQIEF